MIEHKLAKGSLSSKSKKSSEGDEEEVEEPEHAVHIKKLRHGYHIRKHHRDGSETEHAAEDIDGAMDHAVDHLQSDDAQGGQPMQDEQQMAGGGSGDPQMPQQMPQPQGGM